MTYALSGACHCASIRFELTLTSAPDTLHPRACDCGFCRKHGAAYISDPHGALCFYVSEPRHLGKYRQGSAMADFLVCRNCGVLVGVAYVDAGDGKRYASVNGNAIDGAVTFADAIPVSPKKYAASEKRARWTSLWFGNVGIVAMDHGD